jgi:hypothetical protein
MEMHCQDAVAYRLNVIYTHVVMDAIAQYLKANIAGASPTFMKVKLPSLPLLFVTRVTRGVGLSLNNLSG